MGEEADFNQQLAGPTALLFGSVMLTLTIASKYKRQDHLNRSFLAVLAGTLIGLFFRFYVAAATGFNVTHWRTQVLDDSTYKTLQPVVFLIMYPYLYWPSGWFSKVDKVFYHFDWLVLMSLGPVVQTIATTILAKFTNFWWRSLFYPVDVLNQYPLPWTDLYATAACVSIVDPTPMLFTMGDLNVPALVSVSVLWEALAAPDVSTMLVDRASRQGKDDLAHLKHLTLENLWELVGPGHEIFTLFLTSICSGMLVGFFICTLLRTRWLRDRPAWEATFICTSPFFAHAAVQALGLWAILADVPCGLIMNLYGRHQMSNEGLRLADNAVTQLVIFVATLYYIVIAAYFVVFSRGLGLALGVLIFLCSIIGRIASLAICLPTCEALRWMYRRCCKESRALHPTGHRISRLKLALLLFGSQTRGGVWFAWYFKQDEVVQKEMIIDAVLTTWLFSQTIFGFFPRRIYLCSGLPCGDEADTFDGDGHVYDPLWYERVVFLRPVIWMHNRVLSKLFALDSAVSPDDFDEEPAWAEGNRWMGPASLSPRSVILRRASLASARETRTSITLELEHRMTM